MRWLSSLERDGLSTRGCSTCGLLACTKMMAVSISGGRDTTCSGRPLSSRCACLLVGITQTP